MRLSLPRPLSPWTARTQMDAVPRQLHFKFHLSPVLKEFDGRARSLSTSVAAVLLVVACCCCMQPAACRSALYNTSAARVDGKLNVHIISHTHNDPGWISSYAQYHRTLVLDGHTIGGFQSGPCALHQGIHMQQIQRSSMLCLLPSVVRSSQSCLRLFTPHMDCSMLSNACC